MFATLSLTAEQIDQLRNIAAVGGKWLMAAFTALGGITGIVKIITTVVSRKKPVKLTQADYTGIASEILKQTNGSIEINMSSEIDKATRNRLTEVEKVNDIHNLDGILSGFLSRADAWNQSAFQIFLCGFLGNLADFV